MNFYLADLLMSLAVGFILTIIIEIPCHEIAKQIIFHEENKVEELPARRERFGVFYNNDISVTVAAASVQQGG